MSRRIRYILIVATVILAVTGWRVYEHNRQRNESLKRFPDRSPNYDTKVVAYTEQSQQVLWLSIEEGHGTEVLVNSSSVVRGDGPVIGQRVRVWTNGSGKASLPPQVHALYIQYGD